MRDKEGCDPALIKDYGKFVGKPGTAGAVESGEGLIQEEDFRIENERTSETRPLRFATGQRAHRPIRKMRDA